MTNLAQLTQVADTARTFGLRVFDAVDIGEGRLLVVFGVAKFGGTHEPTSAYVLDMNGETSGVVTADDDGKTYTAEDTTGIHGTPRVLISTRTFREAVVSLRKHFAYESRRSVAP